MEVRWVLMYCRRALRCVEGVRVLRQNVWKEVLTVGNSDRGEHHITYSKASTAVNVTGSPNLNGKKGLFLLDHGIPLVHLRWLPYNFDVRGMTVLCGRMTP